jgi:ADP-heptose:LPS heptosyltransferase
VKPETIRAIDVFAGRILCWLLTIHRRLLDFARRGRGPEGPVRSILFLKLVEQGATVLAAGAIERAVSRVGRENVYFCVFAENREILDILDLIPRENVFTLRNKQFHLFLLDVMRMVRRVRKLPIDATVDMEFFARATAILAYLTRAPRRVGLHRFTSEAPYRGDLLTHRVAWNPYLHTAQAYVSLVVALGHRPDEVPLLKVPVAELTSDVPRVEPPSADRARVRAIIEEAAGGPVGWPLVLLNPNASDMLPLRRWPAERFVELGKRFLNGHPEATIAITGAPSEQAAAEGVAAAIGSPRVVSLAGKTTLADLVVLYSLADVLVTNDSGPGHFASLTDIDSIVLFGPETPQLFGALGPRAHIVYAGLACSPCVSALNHRFSPCTNNLCMQAITVEHVLALLNGCLEARAANRAVVGAV